MGVLQIYKKKYWSFFLYRQNQSSNEIAPKTWTMFDSTRYAKSNVSNNNKKTVMEEGKKRFHTKNFESTRKTLVTFPKTATADGFWGKNGIIPAKSAVHQSLFSPILTFFRSPINFVCVGPNYMFFWIVGRFFKSLNSPSSNPRSSSDHCQAVCDVCQHWGIWNFLKLLNVDRHTPIYDRKSTEGVDWSIGRFRQTVYRFRLTSSLYRSIGRWEAANRTTPCIRLFSCVN